MFVYSRLSASTQLVYIIFLHICMTISIAMIFTPMQTHTLNQLPRQQNASGVAIINTLQQVSAAFGSSLFVGLLGSGEANYLLQFSDPTNENIRDAVTAGVNKAFLAALVVVMIGFAVSLFLKRRKADSLSA